MKIYTLHTATGDPDMPVSEPLDCFTVVPTKEDLQTNKNVRRAFIQYKDSEWPEFDDDFNRVGGTRTQKQYVKEQYCGLVKSDHIPDYGLFVLEYNLINNKIS